MCLEFVEEMTLPVDAAIHIDDADVAAVDETAAYLFMNWVYRAILDRSPTYKEVVPGF